MKKKIIYILLGLILLGAGGYCALVLRDNYLELKMRQAQLEKRKIAWQALSAQIRKEVNGFNGEAGIIIKDLKTGWQININEDKPFASASLAKVPIMFSCFCSMNEGGLKLDEVLTLNGKDRVLGSGTLKAFALGSKFTTEKLMELMISESDNTAANILIDRLGFDYINNCFKRVSLLDTNISRKMMDFRSRKQGIENFTTAKDIISLLEKIYQGQLINKEYSQKCLEFLEAQKINDRIPARLPAEAVVAHKTGLERGICHDAGIVFSPGGDFLICVLTKHDSRTARSAKRFIAQISLLAYNYANNRTHTSKIPPVSVDERRRLNYS